MQSKSWLTYLGVFLIFHFIDKSFAGSISESHTIPNVKYVFSIKQKGDNENVQANIGNKNLVLVYPDKIIEDIPKNATDSITIVEPSTVSASNSVLNNTLSKAEIVEEKNDANIPNEDDLNNTTKNPVNNTSQELKAKLFVPIQQSTKNNSRSGYLAKLKKLRDTIYKKHQPIVLKNNTSDFNKTDEMHTVTTISKSRNNTDHHKSNATIPGENIESKNLTAHSNITKKIEDSQVNILKIRNETTDSQMDISKTDRQNNQINISGKSRSPLITNEVSSFDNWKDLDVIPFTIEDAVIPAESEIKLNYVPYVKYKSNNSNQKDAMKKYIKKPVPFLKEKHYTRFNPKLNRNISAKNQIEILDSTTETSYEITTSSKDIFQNTYEFQQPNKGNIDRFSNNHYVLEPFNPTMINGLLIIGPIPKSLPEIYTREPYMSQLSLPRE